MGNDEEIRAAVRWIGVPRIGGDARELDGYSSPLPGDRLDCLLAVVIFDDPFCDRQSEAGMCGGFRREKWLGRALKNPLFHPRSGVGDRYDILFLVRCGGLDRDLAVGADRFVGVREDVYEALLQFLSVSGHNSS